jgi:hypothetical protein
VYCATQVAVYSRVRRGPSTAERFALPVSFTCKGSYAVYTRSAKAFVGCDLHRHVQSRCAWDARMIACATCECVRIAGCMPPQSPCRIWLNLEALVSWGWRRRANVHRWLRVWSATVWPRGRHLGHVVAQPVRCRASVIGLQHGR